MPRELPHALDALQAYPALYIPLSIALLLAVAWLSNWVVKHILVRGLYRTLRSAALGLDKTIAENRVIARLANVVPALVVFAGVALIPDLPGGVTAVVRNVCVASMVLTAALALGGMLDTVNAYHQSRPRTRLRSVKGYVQVVKIAVYAVATILVVAALIDRSPAILLSGLGAMAAVLLLIFQDTLLSLVASVQITTGDLVRIGDWIEMPQLNADGDVVDIALHTVKVQNFDRTITTIPTKKLISDSFRNWRGMKETGARRIKRSLLIDQTSIRFLDADERARLRDFRLIDDYLDGKARELDAWNADLRRQGIKPVNARRVTNVGTFRIYVERYLRSHPGVHQAMSLMVRQLEPTAQGLPIEVYCFSNTTVWTEYEGIQSDIFDHLLATVPDFGLRVFQAPTGADVQSLRPAPTAVPGGAARDSGAAGAFGIEPARQGPPARRGG